MITSCSLCKQEIQPEDKIILQKYDFQVENISFFPPLCNPCWRSHHEADAYTSRYSRRQLINLITKCVNLSDQSSTISKHWVDILLKDSDWMVQEVTLEYPKIFDNFTTNDYIKYHENISNVHSPLFSVFWDNLYNYYTFLKLKREIEAKRLKEAILPTFYNWIRPEKSLFHASRGNQIVLRIRAIIRLFSKFDIQPSDLSPIMDLIGFYKGRDSLSLDLFSTITLTQICLRFPELHQNLLSLALPLLSVFEYEAEDWFTTSSFAYQALLKFFNQVRNNKNFQSVLKEYLTNSDTSLRQPNVGNVIGKNRELDEELFGKLKDSSQSYYEDEDTVKIFAKRWFFLDIKFRSELLEFLESKPILKNSLIEDLANIWGGHEKIEDLMPMFLDYLKVIPKNVYPHSLLYLLGVKWDGKDKQIGNILHRLDYHSVKDILKLEINNSEGKQ